jgi:hypothetical protein
MNMSTQLSVLQKAATIAVETSPFPYLVIADALPNKLASKLTNEFPLHLFDLAKQNLSDDNNKRIDISAVATRDMENAPDIWREFLEYHSSDAFLKEVITVFGAEICKAFPKYYPNQAALNTLVSGRKGLDNKAQTDILLDTAISINTPVTKTSAVRAIHTDHGDKLFSALSYLRRPEDDSTGGNLQILKWKDGYSPLQKRMFYEEGVNPKHTQLVREIAYSNNVFVIFINSLDALHAVTPRAETEYDRTFVNFIGIVPHKLFKKELSIAKKLRKLLGKKSTPQAY